MFLFVGEKPSRLAAERGVTWKDGRLAAKQLFDALDAAGIDPASCDFVNLFGDDPEAPVGKTVQAMARARGLSRRRRGRRIVALGQKVSTVLEACGIRHIRVVHPAARGTIRRKDLYAEHVRAALLAPGTGSAPSPRTTEGESHARTCP